MQQADISRKRGTIWKDKINKLATDSNNKE
jgi:hypothetical protein